MTNTITRVAFTPRTNTQRSAVARFGADWQLAAGFPARFLIHGVVSAFIHPIGQRGQGRWVSVEQVKLVEG